MTESGTQISGQTSSTSKGSKGLNKLLATLPDDEYRRVLAQTRPVPLNLREVLYPQGHIIKDIYFPVSGACSITRTMQDGSIAEMATIGNEGLVGASVFFGDDRSHGEALVQVGGEGCVMPVASFLEEMDRRGAFYNRVLRYSQALMVQAMQTTACNGLHSVEQRCCRWLLMTSDRAGGNDISLTHDFLAIMLGVRRSSVTVTIGELQAAGVIETRRGMIRLVDRQRLEQTSCECYAVVKAAFRRILPEIPDPVG